MKPSSYFLTLIFITLTLFTFSCNDGGSDNNPVPTPPPIVISLSPNFGPEGTLVTARGLNLLNLDSVKIGKTRVNILSAVDSLLRFTVPNTATTGKVYFYKGNTTDSSQSFTVIPSNGVLTEYDAILLNPPLAGNQSSTFFSTLNGKTYSFTSAAIGSNSDSVDFGYFFSSNFGITFTSASNYIEANVWNELLQSWKTRNLTTFKKLLSQPNNQSYFQGLNRNGQLDTLFSGGTDIPSFGTSGIAGQRIGNLSSGDIFTLITAGNKKAVVYIQSFSPGSGSFGNVVIRVKVQK